MIARRSWILLLAILLAAPAAAQKPAADAAPTVAILYFDYEGKDEQMGMLRKGLAQMLISDLSSLEGVRIVERDRLEAILAEIKLGQTAKIDKATAAKVGKLLGAKYMVLGGYFDLMGALRADARVVEVETGRVVQSVGANGKPDDFMTVEQSLAGSLSDVFSKKLKITAAAPANPTPTTGTPALVRKRPKPPAKLPMKTALAYSAALAQIDAGQKDKAKDMLADVVKQQPDFQLAAADLDKLMQ